MRDVRLCEIHADARKADVLPRELDMGLYELRVLLARRGPFDVECDHRRVLVEVDRRLQRAGGGAVGARAGRGDCRIDASRTPEPRPRGGRAGLAWSLPISGWLPGSR